MSPKKARKKGNRFRLRRIVLTYKQNRSLPAHITIPNWDAYQVRIVRNGREYSASFSWNMYGTEKAALAHAVKWRDTILAALPPSGNERGQFRTKPLSHKQSWGRVGITRYITADARKAGRPEYLRFGVNWVDSAERRRTKSFQVGRVGEIEWELELHAANTAEAFRTEWEFCQATGRPFDDEKYREWRERRLYPFLPVAAPA